MLGPIKLAWDKLVWDRLVDRARGKLVVRVCIHHAYLDGQEPAFFINMQNQSPQRSAMVTHVWLEMTQDVPILSKPLPRKIDPNSESETFIPSRARRLRIHCLPQRWLATLSESSASSRRSFEKGQARNQEFNVG